MRGSLLAAILAVLLLAAPAGSATLSLTGSTLSLTLGSLPAVSVAQSPAAIGGILVSSGGGSFVLPSGVFASTQVVTIPFTPTGVPLISGLTAIVSNGTLAVTPAGGPNGGAGGDAYLAGTLFINVLNLFNLTVPLSVVGGPTPSISLTAGGVLVMVEGTGWTTGQIVLSNVSSATRNTLTSTGFDNRTAGHAGVIRLVTPIRAISSATGTLGGFVVKTLTFTPEPRTLLLLAAAAGGAAALGVRKRRRR